jgi:hypothetical protein
MAFTSLVPVSQEFGQVRLELIGNNVVARPIEVRIIARKLQSSFLIDRVCQIELRNPHVLTSLLNSALFA